MSAKAAWPDSLYSGPKRSTLAGTLRRPGCSRPARFHGRSSLHPRERRLDGVEVQQPEQPADSEAVRKPTGVCNVADAVYGMVANAAQVHG